MYFFDQFSTLEMIRWAEAKTATVQLDDEFIFPEGRHVIAKQTETEGMNIWVGLIYLKLNVAPR